MSATYIWAMPAILVAIVVLALLVIFLRKKDKNPPDYYSFFILGICWMPLGVIIENWGLAIIGFVFMAIGLKNKDQWKQNHVAWKNMPKEQKRLKLIITIVLGVLVLAGLVAYYLSAKK